MATYSLKAQGKNFRISANFTLGEMACRDGSDTVKVDGTLLSYLEKLRAYFGRSVTITSGYRTPTYNKKIGGAKSSQHLLGTAADVSISGVPVDVVACVAQDIGFKGIGLMKSAVHLDMRSSGRYRGDEYKGGRKNYSSNVSDFYSYCKLSKKDVEKYKYKNPEEDEMTEAEARKIAKAVYDEINPQYNEVGDVPSYWRPDVQEMVNNGFIAGDGTHNVAKRKDVIEAMVPLWRSIKVLANNEHTATGVDYDYILRTLAQRIMYGGKSK